MTATITALDVARKAIELCEAHPDHVYEAQTLDTEYRLPQCHYVHTDEESGALYGGCLFGQALIELGVPADDLKDFNDKGIGYVLNAIGAAEIPEKQTAVHPLSYVQGSQDCEQPWGSEDVLGRLRWFVRTGQ